MILTITKARTDKFIYVGCNDERIKKQFGTNPVLVGLNPYQELSVIADWVNNELGEECLFEID